MLLLFEMKNKQIKLFVLFLHSFRFYFLNNISIFYYISIIETYLNPIKANNKHLTIQQPNKLEKSVIIS